MDMDNEDTPVGKRFSHLYMERGEPQKDSKRFRKRLSAYFNEHLDASFNSSVVKAIEQELGVDVPVLGVGYRSFELFFDKSELRDVLDSITVISNVLNYSIHYFPGWAKFVQRVFKEENLGYRLDGKGGVHYFVDEEFERNRFFALSCLTDSRYAAVATAFEDSYQKLDSNPADTKGSARSIFEAVEILYKLIINAEKKDRLNSFGIQKNLKPFIQKIYEHDITAATAANHLLDGLCDWIDALHMYRHGQKVEEPASPPMELTIEMLSLGATFLRWLVEIDKITRASNRSP